MVKRKTIQLLSALLYNANIAGFANGTIFTGDIKGVCVPGLNCYSCPGAIAACPLGSLQAALGEVKYKLPLYTIGLLLLFGILLGRGICAFLCPFGLIQELLHKIPTPKLGKSKWTRRASLIKYVVLFVFVLFLPLFFLAKDGVSLPAFCEFICPAGTLTGGVPLIAANESLQAVAGTLFDWKIAVLVAIVLVSVFAYRAFCRFICPLGAIYSLFNKAALFGVKVNEHNCAHCGACVSACKLDTHKVNDRECIRCGECRAVCKHNAIYCSNKKEKQPCEAEKEPS
ncbi:MAG TPA: 4Fe-4S ferredoxin [Clostridiales bacterium]|nr:4Fe-4S ferredoxin [Clostridiales bacterium]